MPEEVPDDKLPPAWCCFIPFVVIVILLNVFKMNIVVCLLAAVWSAQHGGSRLMAWAMAFTLAADTFLLLLDRWYGMGIVLFCVVQGLYLARIRRACGRTLWALRAGLAAAAWVLLNALGMGTALNLLAALYFVNFLVNACQSLTLRSERLFAAGLWLFLLCDVCVGLRNQPSLLPGLAGAAQAGMWLFYLPGQVLLVLSGFPKRRGNTT